MATLGFEDGLLTTVEYAKSLASSFSVVDIKGQPWYCHNKKLMPVVSPNHMSHVDEGDVRKAMKQTGALVAVWNDQWDTPPCEWWWVCCTDQEYDLAKIPSKSRRESIRRGLRRCEVRRVAAEWFAHHGYDVCNSAVSSYESGQQRITSDEFARGVLRNAAYAGRETWGAFYEGKLAAYISCVVVGDTVYRASSKSNPAAHKAYPNDALSYVTAFHYLRERGLKVVTNGSRVLEHKTRVQDFLETMGFRRVYCPLKVVLHPLAWLAVRSNAPRWGSRLGLSHICSKQWPKLCALYRLDQIARSCSTMTAITGCSL